MLPAYLSYFVGIDGADQAAAEDDPESVAAPRSGVAQALRVSGIVSAGFLVVFGVTGLLVNAGVRTVIDIIPYLALGVGIIMIGLGIAVFRGLELSIGFLKVGRGASARDTKSVFGFGVSYAVASLSCTLPIFLGVTATTFRNSNLASGVSVFAAYALGMGLVLMVLTVAIALARQTLVSRLRSAMRWVNPVSAVLLLVAGAYVAYYGWYELRVRNDPETFAGPAQWVTDLQTDIQIWIQDVGAVRLGLVLALLVTLAALYAVLRPWRSRPGVGSATAPQEDEVVETSR
jgi:cytochrome c biogenesis protein CcdA